MKAEIISIGTELTTGQNLDTNSQWLSQELAQLGVVVGYHTTIADNLDDQAAAFRLAAERTQLVIITGGLGPTLDDLTREALAQAAKVELNFHEELFATIVAMFANRNRPMPERNRIQAYLPAGAEVIPNELGTAPGVWMKMANAMVAALPGVPSEMKPMFNNWVRPRLPATEKQLFVRKIHTFGAGESAVEELLRDVTARGREPEVGITASQGTITLRIVAHTRDEASAKLAIAPVEQTIRERLGQLAFGVDDEQLHDVVARLLIEKQMTIATAESVTAGQVAERLARVPGASDWLCGGAVTYVNGAKAKILGVPESLLNEHGAVSAAVAEAMAVGARKLFNTDLAISTTGLAGPSDGGEGKPIGLCFFGIASAQGVESRQVNWFGIRKEIQARAALSAINLVRLWLTDGLKA